MSAVELTRATAAELADLLAAGEVSAVEVTTAHLDRVDAVDERVHAFLHVARDQALADAALVDGVRAAGQVRHALAGVPVAVKDVIATEGLPTTCGSRILAGWVPPYDATLVRRLREAGLVVLGKTNMDEFAMGSSPSNSAPSGPTRNPWETDRIPGGSGGGSAAAVASFRRRSRSHRQPAGRSGSRRRSPHRRGEAQVRRGVAG